MHCKVTFSPDSKKALSLTQKAKMKFCSRECWKTSLFRQVTRKCERCDKEFSVYRARSHARFCSRECHAKKIEKPCPICGAIISVKQSAGPKRVTCSRRCNMLLRAAENRAPRQGKPPSPEAKAKISEGLRKYYKWSPGRHWNFQGGPNGSRRGGWLKQRDLTRARDSDTCQACQVTAQQYGKHIPVHHIKPYRQFEDHEQANDLSNLISLCQSCHMKAEHGKLSIIPRYPSLATHPS